MDLTSLAAVLMVAFGLLSADAVLHYDNIVVEVVAPPRSEKISIDEATLDLTFENQLNAVASTESLVDPPEIHAKRRQGVGMALAELARAQGVAYALQAELGYVSDKLRLAIYLQSGTLHGFLSGNGRRYGTFEETLEPRDNENLTDFVRRAAIVGASHIAPYTTTLYLLQQHAQDKQFDDLLALAAKAQAKLPPTPFNLQRSLYENVRGIVALFRNETKAAKAAFAAAVAADPKNPAAVLNLGFAEVEVDEYKAAAERMERFITAPPTTNNILLGTAYMTWAAAEMGLRDIRRADELMAKAMNVYPTSSTGFDLWAEAKELQGDHAAAVALRHKALEATADAFENYAEVAALYFHLSWHDNVPVMRNKFDRSAAVTLR
jgi:tetratricopeptide (TPR) repeat protein